MKTILSALVLCLAIAQPSFASGHKEAAKKSAHKTDHKSAKRKVASVLKQTETSTALYEIVKDAFQVPLADWEIKFSNEETGEKTSYSIRSIEFNTGEKGDYLSVNIAQKGNGAKFVFNYFADETLVALYNTKDLSEVHTYLPDGTKKQVAIGNSDKSVKAYGEINYAQILHKQMEEMRTEREYDANGVVTQESFKKDARLKTFGIAHRSVKSVDGESIVYYPKQAGDHPKKQMVKSKTLTFTNVDGKVMQKTMTYHEDGSLDKDEPAAEVK